MKHTPIPVLLCSLLVSSCATTQTFLVSKLDPRTSDVHPYKLNLDKSESNYQAGQFNVLDTSFILRLNNTVRQDAQVIDPVREGTEITLAAWQAEQHASIREVAGTITLNDGTTLQPGRVSLVKGLCVPGWRSRTLQPLEKHSIVAIAGRSNASTVPIKGRDVPPNEVEKSTCISFFYRQKISPTQPFGLLIGTIGGVGYASYEMRLSLVPAIYVAHTH